MLLRTERPSEQPWLWELDDRDGLWKTAANNNWRLTEPFGDDEAEWEDISFPRCSLKTLRPDQEKAKNAWLQTKRGVVVMATGTGKTEVAFHIAREIGSHTLFIAPTRALAYQLATRIEKAFGTPVGFIGDHTFRTEPISVATYHSAAIKMEFVGDYFKLLVFDECHHLTGGFFGEAARTSAAPFRLGLTATPQRSDGSLIDYEELIGPICHATSISDVRGTVLADYKVVRIPVYLTDSEQKHYDALGMIVSDHMVARREKNPMYDWEEVCRQIGKDPEARHAFRAHLKRRSIEDNAVAKLDVLEDLFREHSQQVVVFTGSNHMARAVATRFLIPCLLSHSSRKERERTLDGYERGHFRAIIANRVLNEGIDVPSAKVGIVVGGTGSPREATQRLGRILRDKSGQKAILYEVVCKETGEEERSRKRRKSDAYTRRSVV